MPGADRGMEKHTLRLGWKYGDVGETVSFTAKRLGTAHANGGKEVEGGTNYTFYRLPDGCYRVLTEKDAEGDTAALLEPSNMTEAFRRGEPVNYWRWTEEELHRGGEFGEIFEALMKHHPERRS